MSFPANHFSSPTTGGSGASSLLTPSGLYSRGSGSFEPALLGAHPMPLKCRSPNRVATPLQQPNRYISALDHLSTKLRIPMSAVETTQALEDDGLVPGICRLYLEGRCRQGERCFQVHANPMVVEQLRQEALSAPSCCHTHGAECNYEGFPLGLTVTLEPPKERGGHAAATKSSSKPEENGMSNTDDTSSTVGSKENNGDETEPASRLAVVSLHSLCPTMYLWKLYSSSGQMHLRVPRNKICREHRKGLCRFGSACSFLHVCRQIPLENERVGERAETTVTSPLLSPPSRSHNGRTQVPLSLSDHFGAHGSHFGNNSSVPMYSVADQSASFSRPASKPLLTPSHSMPSGNQLAEPLLRPADQCTSPNLGTSGRHFGSFSHNPYADASSLQ